MSTSAGGTSTGLAVWTGVATGAVVGLWPLSLVDVLLLLAPSAVLPMALGQRRWWAVAAASTFVALLVPAGALAGVLVTPWLAAAVRATVAELQRLGPLLFWRRTGAARLLAAVYAVVAGGALLQSRLGAELLGIGEPIVQLTAVHYAFAGTAALVLATAVDRRRHRRAADAALVLTAVAPPVVAVGFVTGAAVPQVGGAVVMTLGVCTTAALQLGEATSARTGPPGRRLLLGVSGTAVWVPMVLAVAWAAAQFWPVPALSIPDMARTHGALNALGFAACGLLARQPLDRQPIDDEDGDDLGVGVGRPPLEDHAVAVSA